MVRSLSNQVQLFFDKFLRLLRGRKAEEFTVEVMTDVISRYVDLLVLVHTSTIKVDDPRIHMVNVKLVDAIGEHGKSVVKQAARKVYESDVSRLLDASSYAFHQMLHDMPAAEPTPEVTSS